MRLFEIAASPHIACPEDEIHPERRRFPFVSTLIGALLAVNVASTVLTLME